MPAFDFGPETSASLLLRIRDPNDTESWQLFGEVYTPIIRTFCRRRGLQATDIDDITQDVLASVAKAIRTFEYQPERGKFRSWLATITVNKIKTFATRKKRGNEPTVDITEIDVESPEVTAEWSSVFLQNVFEKACQRVRPHFSDQTWACFDATWIQKKPAVDVAEELGIPIHTVYVNKSRVIKRLEAEFLFLSEDLPTAD